MIEPARCILGDWDADDEAIADVMGLAIEDALREHKRDGVSIAVWDWDRDGVRIIAPDEIAEPSESTLAEPSETSRLRS
ncbi:MAG: hypothetical protein JWN86_2204 [Planctomycetota bacterium]|nr:hypothetical protein [Planctomycetota bacterium]